MLLTWHSLQPVRFHQWGFHWLHKCTCSPDGWPGPSWFVLFCYDNWTHLNLSIILFLSLKHTHETQSPLFLCSSYMCITISKLYKMQMYMSNSWKGQRPPSQNRRIEDDKLKWRIFFHLSDRQQCMILPQTKQWPMAPPLLGRHNLSAQTQIKDHVTASLVMKAGMSHLLLPGLLIEPNWCCDRWRGEGCMEQRKVWKQHSAFI